MKNLEETKIEFDKRENLKPINVNGIPDGYAWDYLVDGKIAYKIAIYEKDSEVKMAYGSIIPFAPSEEALLKAYGK